MSAHTEFLGAIKASAATKRRYLGPLTRFARWAGQEIPIDDLQVNRFLTFLETDLGQQEATIAVAQAALTRLMRYHRIPVDRIEAHTVTLKDPKYLSKNQIRDLLNADPSPLVQCVIAILYDSGARITEPLDALVANIDWGDDVAGGFIRDVVRKGGRRDTLNVSAWGMAYLKAWMKARKGNHPKIFGDWTYQEIYRFLKAAASKAGFKFNPHMLRHSRAVHLREDGADWVDIGYHLGHTRPSKTQDVYARPVPEDLKKMIPGVNLDGV